MERLGAVVTWAELRRRRRNLLAALGLAAIAAFVIALLALHAATYQHQPPTHMSQFANSRFGLLWMLAVYTFILGGAMVVWALKPTLPDCPSKLAGMVMLWLAAFGALLLATFPTDATYPITWVGRVHNDAAVTTFACLGAAMVVLAPAFRASPTLGRFAGLSLMLGVLVTVSWITYIVTTLNGLGLHAAAQRILVALITSWFVLLALMLRRHDRPAPDPAAEPVPGMPPRVAVGSLEAVFARGVPRTKGTASPASLPASAPAKPPTVRTRARRATSRPRSASKARAPAPSASGGTSRRRRPDLRALYATPAGRESTGLPQRA